MHAGALLRASKVLQSSWHARWRRSSLGQRLFFGLLLLNGLAVFYLLSLHQQMDTLQQRVKVRQQQVAQRMTLPEASGERDPAARVWAFESAFPIESSVPDALAQINTIVTAAQLHIDEADYRLVELPNSRLRAYQINMPLRGRYSNILQVCLTLLEQMPNLALNNVSFQRKAVADSQAEAILSMTLYLRHS